MPARQSDSAVATMLRVLAISPVCVCFFRGAGRLVVSPIDFLFANLRLSPVRMPGEQVPPEDETELETDERMQREAAAEFLRLRQEVRPRNGRPGDPLCDRLLMVTI